MADADRSGQVTVTTAGTAVQGSDVSGVEFEFAAHPANTGAVYIGNVSGDVASTNGFPLGYASSGLASPSVRLMVGNLQELYFDAAQNGDKICWIKVR